MDNSVVTFAKKLGCICKQTQYEKWEISSSAKAETWKLARTEERWLLSINSIPQLYLSDQQAITFLERRYN